MLLLSWKVLQDAQKIWKVFGINLQSFLHRMTSWNWKWLCSTKGKIRHEPNIKLRLRVPFHKGLVTPGVHYILLLRSGPNMTSNLAFEIFPSLQKQRIVDFTMDLAPNKPLNKKQIADIRIRTHFDNQTWFSSLSAQLLTNTLIETVFTPSAFATFELFNSNKVWMIGRLPCPLNTPLELQLLHFKVTKAKYATHYATS